MELRQDTAGWLRKKRSQSFQLTDEEKMQQWHKNALV